MIVSSSSWSGQEVRICTRGDGTLRQSVLYIYIHPFGFSVLEKELTGFSLFLFDFGLRFSLVIYTFFFLARFFYMYHFPFHGFFSHRFLDVHQESWDTIFTHDAGSYTIQYNPLKFDFSQCCDQSDTYPACVECDLGEGECVTCLTAIRSKCMQARKSLEL